MAFNGFRKALMRYFRCRFVGGGAPSWAQNPGRMGTKAEEKRRRSGGEAEEKRRKSGGKAEEKRRESGGKAESNGPRRTQVIPKAARETPRRPQDAPRGVQDTILVGFRCQNGAKLVPKSDKKSMLTSKSDFLKIELSLQRGLEFSGFGGQSWKQKSFKN